MRAIVYHSRYGCDTGCCGHVIELWDGKESAGHRFRFDHPPLCRPGEARMAENLRDFAERLVREEFGEQHVGDLDWEECWVVDD